MHFVGYADDFIVTATSEETAGDIAEVVKEFLKEGGPELSEERTHITHNSCGFDFLDWTNRQIQGKTLDKPSKK